MKERWQYISFSAFSSSLCFWLSFSLSFQFVPPFQHCAHVGSLCLVRSKFIEIWCEDHWNYAHTRILRFVSSCFGCCLVLRLCAEHGDCCAFSKHVPIHDAFRTLFRKTCFNHKRNILVFSFAVLDCSYEDITISNMGPTYWCLVSRRKRTASLIELCAFWQASAEQSGILAWSRNRIKPILPEPEPMLVSAATCKFPVTHWTVNSHMVVSRLSQVSCLFIYFS